MLKLNNIHSTAIGSKKKSNRKLENTLRKMKINTTYENVWDIARAGLRRKFVVIQVYVKKEERLKINNLTLYLRDLEKWSKLSPKFVGKKEIQNRNKQNREYKIKNVGETKFSEKVSSRQAFSQTRKEREKI